MRLAWGLATIACALALAGCGDDRVDIVDSVSVEDVPACLTWPVELAGNTYWSMNVEQRDQWLTNHEDPYGGTPQPQASAEWPDGAHARGVLYRYEDGTALFIGAGDNRVYFTDEEREFDAVC